MKRVKVDLHRVGFACCGFFFRVLWDILSEILPKLAKSRLPIAMVLTRNWNPQSHTPRQLQLSMLLPDRLSDVHECDWDGFLKTLFNTKPWPYAVAFQNVLQFTTIHNSWLDGSHHFGPNLGLHIQGLRSERKFTGQIGNWTYKDLIHMVLTPHNCRKVITFIIDISFLSYYNINSN